MRTDYLGQRWFKIINFLQIIVVGSIQEAGCLNKALFYYYHTNIMGLDPGSIKFLCAARALVVNFANTLTIGRQSVLADETSLQNIFSAVSFDQDARDFLRKNKYGEKLFSLLGAKETNSLDYSAYEGATILQDMNSPVPAHLHQRFSLIYDGGTLEHVFNIPQALKNCMNMVQVGGHFVQVNIANNFMGHGFWQFSPELLFRVFSPVNGFEIVAVLLHEVVPDGAWFLVTDPDKVRQRVMLCNHLPIYICTIAKRTSAVEIFSSPPLQSDYSALWEQKAREQSAHRSNDDDQPASAQPKRLRNYLPRPIRKLYWILRQRLWSLNMRAAFERPYYRRIREENLLRGILE
jgi:hypothetical protein